MNSMKPSGIEWIGDIPAEWEIKKIKHIFQIVCGSTPESNNTDFWDGDISWITPADMNDFGRIAKGERNITEKGYNSCGTSLLPNGSIVISTRAPIGKINITVSELCTNQGCKSLVNPNLNTNYFYYFLNAGQEELIRQGRGTTFVELGTFELGNIFVVFPPPKEQQAIAAFLDAKCGRIDDIIAEMEQQIEALKQYKTSLITETVTKGLDKAAPMKDSGIEWIGKIPAHWEVGRIKYCYDIILGKMLQPFQERSTDREMNYMCSANVTWNGIDLSVLKKMWFTPFEIRAYLLQKGDLLVAEGGDVGTASIWNNEVDKCCIQNALHLIRENGKYSNRYLYYWLYFLKYNGYIDLVCNKATIAHFTKEKIGDSPFCVLPLVEQEEIANFLDDRIKKTDGIIAEKRQSIETMKAYKKSLIYEYVTGKKRITGTV